MGEQTVQLPSDAANTGKKLRVRERTVGANTIEEHYFIPQRLNVVTGVYYYTSGVLSVTAAADTFPAGRFFLVNPTGSAILLAVRKCELTWTANAATATLAATRVALRRFSYTGTPSGATAALTKRDTNDSAPTPILYTANTGMTITSQGDIYAWSAPSLITAVGAIGGGGEMNYDPYNDDGFVVLRALEGVMIWQPDAGVTSDPRRYSINVVLEQYTLP